jgi:hypothetical protein
MHTNKNPRVIDGTYRASRDPVFLAAFALEAIVIGGLVVALYYI